MGNNLEIERNFPWLDWEIIQIQYATLCYNTTQLQYKQNKQTNKPAGNIKRFLNGAKKMLWMKTPGIEGICLFSFTFISSTFKNKFEGMEGERDLYNWSMYNINFSE